MTTNTAYITDDDLRARGVSELDIDALDRQPATQKGAARSTEARPRQAVEAWLKANGRG